MNELLKLIDQSSLFAASAALVSLIIVTYSTWMAVRATRHVAQEGAQIDGNTRAMALEILEAIQAEIENQRTSNRPAGETLERIDALVKMLKEIERKGQSKAELDLRRSAPSAPQSPRPLRG